MSKDKAASIRGRLLQLAKAEQSNFDQVLVRFALERILYRLGQSPYADRFVLKGALLFALWYDMPHRPTRDVDLLPAPQLRTYPVYTVVAEKLHAIVLLGMGNTRMKDYYDLMVLLENEALNEALLVQAIHATFTRRQTAILTAKPTGLSDNFAASMSKQTQWLGFLQKSDLRQLPLANVVELLRGKLARPLMLAANFKPI